MICWNVTGEAGLTNSVLSRCMMQGLLMELVFLFCWFPAYFGGFYREVEGVRIKKVINNNILCAVDDKGEELIVTGKGIGFKRFPGEPVNSEQIERLYRMEGKEEQRKLRKEEVGTD